MKLADWVRLCSYLTGGSLTILATATVKMFPLYTTQVLFIVAILWPIERWNGISLLKLARYIRTELLIVFGTSSSESVFPQLVQKLRSAGCQDSIVGLVLPTGYAFNHDGTCLYFAAAPIFLAQALGIELSLWQQLSLLGILLITSKGGAGVASSALVVLVSTLAATNFIPVAAVGIILGVHRLMSSAFVVVNILGNSLATIVIANSEGAIDRAALTKALASSQS